MGKMLSAKTIGILAGLAAMALVLFLAEGASLILAPLPDGLDPNDKSAIAAHVAGLPLLPKLVLVLGWFVSSLVGAAVAKRISGHNWPTWVVALGAIALVVPALVAYPRPDWMFAAALVLPLAAAFVVNRALPRGAPMEVDPARDVAPTDA